MNYGYNVIANQSKYILIYALSISLPLNLYDSWLVDSGASRHSSSIKKSYQTC